MQTQAQISNPDLTSAMYTLADKLKELREQKKQVEDELKSITEQVETVNAQLAEMMANSETQNFIRAGTMFRSHHQNPCIRCVGCERKPVCGTP